MERLVPYLLVGAGGFLGANARFLVGRWVGGWTQVAFPLGTFLVNASGSFLAGVLGALISQRMAPHSESMRLALGVGFLGAYTTFSAFEFETHRLLTERAWWMASAYVAGSVFMGLLAVRAGILAARSWLG